jgi:hypothetical protein
MRRLVHMGSSDTVIPQAPINGQAVLDRHVHSSAYPTTILGRRLRGDVRSTFNYQTNECCNTQASCMDFMHVVHTGATLI